jgi:hypothetical protein
MFLPSFETNNTVSRHRSVKYITTNVSPSSAGFPIRRDCQISALVFEDLYRPLNLKWPLQCPSNLRCLELIRTVSQCCEYGSSFFWWAQKFGFHRGGVLAQAVATPPPGRGGFHQPCLSKNCPAQDPLVNCTRNDTVFAALNIARLTVHAAHTQQGWNILLHSASEELRLDQSLCPSVSSVGFCPTTSEPSFCKSLALSEICAACCRL